MKIGQLDVYSLRNISRARFQFSPRFNVILGPNGSGKTTLLEAIYMLGTGHSFRTRETTPLIQTGQSSFTLFARTFTDQTISIQKSKKAPLIVKLNQQLCRKSSELAYFLPCQLFYQDMFYIIDAGPAVRRNLLDWGMFHVKPDYLLLHKRMLSILKQRNALLRRKSSQKELLPWNHEFEEVALQIHEARDAYFNAWNTQFKELVRTLLPIRVELVYDKGWGHGEDLRTLKDILMEKYESDLVRQYTQCGPHQADLVIVPTLPGKAKTTLSRGQQKMLLIALKLSQTSLLKQDCIYLFDDLTAELDENNINKVFTYLSQIEGQFFVTTPKKDSIDMVYLGDACREIELSSRMVAGE